MAARICTVCMGICRISALVTVCNNFIAYPLMKALVKNKINPMKLIVEPFFLNLIHVMNYPSL